MTHDRLASDLLAHHGAVASSPSAHLLDELTTFAHRPLGDEPDPRPLPEPEAVEAALGTVFEVLSGLLTGTRLEDELPDLLWSLVNLLHRKAERLSRRLDDNAVAQRRSVGEQDGSEVRSVELERLLAEGLAAEERRNAFEFLRDYAADLHAAETGTAWRPRAGSLVSHATMTAAVVDSRDYLNARRVAQTELLVPKGPRIAFTGGHGFNDVARIWDALDRVHGKHPGMVLLHGGSPKGAELIAAKWADHRKIAQVAFKPDWARHKNAAPFKRNDAMLEALPIGVVAFPGSGISQNLADKARKLGIPVMRFEG